MFLIKSYDIPALTYGAAEQTCDWAAVCSSKVEICSKCGAEVIEDSKKAKDDLTNKRIRSCGCSFKSE